MNVAILYPWLKAAHVASAIVFVGGALAVATLLATVSAEAVKATTLAHRLRRWDYKITAPALIISFACGLILAFNAQWFGAAWLHAKLLLALVLACIHGAQAGCLRRIACGATLVQRQLIPLTLVCCVTAIAVLAIVKP
ncbi:TPA: CopD family protein [Klebsiella aerogenes]|uniref:CopD family protein n=1 Tax=Enterobacterales TaxID=91347 RepID=UPI000949F3A2|nr:hypothetical protein [Klebsiella pneumoniae]HDT6511381.1 CopD family protein [Klebsiella aerogenes]